MRIPKRILWVAVAVSVSALATATFFVARLNSTDLLGAVGLSRTPAKTGEPIYPKEQDRYIWCGGKKIGGSGGERCVWIARDGSGMGEALETRGSLIPIVKPVGVLGAEEAPPPDGQAMAAIASVIDLLKASNLRFQEVRVDLLERSEGEVKIENGPRIRFSLLFDASFARPILTRLKEQDKLSSLEYLDLRVENRAYYK